MMKISTCQQLPQRLKRDKPAKTWTFIQLSHGSIDTENSKNFFTHPMLYQIETTEHYNHIEYNQGESSEKNSEIIIENILESVFITEKRKEQQQLVLFY